MSLEEIVENATNDNMMLWHSKWWKVRENWTAKPDWNETWLKLESLFLVLQLHLSEKGFSEYQAFWILRKI